MRAGDWVVFDLSVGQIKELRGDDCATFSDGSFETSGPLVDRCRPLTLRNKRIVEDFHVFYNRLRQIDGEAGFNYPDIVQYFSGMAREAIDHKDREAQLYDKAQQFIQDAKAYKPVIDGVRLFRRKLGAA